jgi:ElaB/YqjD/DUF883 family membrane-anchored ribosome-binding protein
MLSVFPRSAGEDDASPEHCLPRHVAPDVTSHSCKRIIGMSGSSRYTRAISAEVGEIERRLRALEKDLEKIGARASSSARDTAEGLGDAIASALGGWADRFRQSATVIGGQSASVGKDAARLGSNALTRVSEETGAHPLFALAVAVGIGVLIGVASRSRD